MAHAIKSQYELTMERLAENGQIRTLDPQVTGQFRKEIQEEMETYHFEKQRKAAQSEKHAAEVILTA